ncbi:YHS domain protein [Actinomadura adrarensis]|uniref:YHS domain protein n=1 Tax=Actinomadura adrarensis TaxID=1819600 RepID=A0ABW3CNP5_9ACTN
MLFIELFVPKNRLDADRRRKIAQGCLAALNPGDVEMDQDPRAEAVFKSQFNVVVHAPETWVVGEDVVGADGPAPYLVRVHGLGAWVREGSKGFISALTKVIVDEDPRAAVQVQVVGVPDGSLGIGGKPQTAESLVELMNEPLQQDLAEGKAVIDPICGMVAVLDTAPTVEWDGTTYGFCSAVCRTAFLKQREAVG